MKFNHSKKCIQCLKTFFRKEDVKNTRWKNTRFCSRECFYESRRGKPFSGTPGGFKKGYKPTEVHLKRLSESHLGNTRGNKGMRMDQEFREKCRQRMLGKKQVRSEEGKKAFSEKMSGPNNPRWISDRNLLKKRQERNDSAYGYWRRQVWRRDNFKCRINNEDCDGRLEAHHVLGWSEFPELRYDINNGITLCRAHHPRKRAEEKRLIPVFRELVSVSIVPQL